MSLALISLNPDLRRLRDEGYEVEVRQGHLLIHNIPYLNGRREVCRGTLVSPLEMAGGDRTARPQNHVAYFVGEHPCRFAGGEILAIRHSSGRHELAQGLPVDHSFSNKPANGYADYYEKMTRYISIIAAEAKAVDPEVDARSGRLVEQHDAASVFLYTDTASSRAGITALTERLAQQRIAIVGLGGSGSYVLDFASKTPASIDLFDADGFWQHNAFRAPGAAGPDLWSGGPPAKVDHFLGLYSKMRGGLTAHRLRIDESNLELLLGYDIVFVCVDKGSVRRLILDFLIAAERKFIDCGVGVQLNEERSELLATCRVTAGVPGRYDHIRARVPMADDEINADYASNIQIVELNAATAVFAVTMWKKLSGFYSDERGELHMQWSVSLGLLNVAAMPRVELQEAA